MAGTWKRLSVSKRQLIFRPLTKLNNCWLIKIGKGDSGPLRPLWFRLHVQTAVRSNQSCLPLAIWVHASRYEYSNTYGYKYICIYVCTRIFIVCTSTFACLPCHKPANLKLALRHLDTCAQFVRLLDMLVANCVNWMCVYKKSTSIVKCI